MYFRFLPVQLIFSRKTNHTFFEPIKLFMTETILINCKTFSDWPIRENLEFVFS